MEAKYDHLSAEKQAQELWKSNNTYAAVNFSGPLYSIDTPPPTVSGSLHIGHIFSYTQTDIIARYKRMSGFSVLYPFGFDDNGLPTERYVEKKLNIRSHTLPRSEFIGLCLKETELAGQQFKALWQQMGLSADWSVCYSTISPTTQKLAQESFIALYKKGHIYRDQEPALYCTACRTTVAQAELDDIEKPSTFNDIVFKDAQGRDLIISTTRPELLPSCVALLYHPSDERYQYLKDTKAIVPIFGHEVPVFADESVDPGKGSGLVMCCTFGDKTDIAWFKKFKLPYRQSIGLDGKFMESTGILAGLKVADARAKVLEALRAENLLLTQKPITHAVNVHERCKNDIEYVVLPQWFIGILKHKETLVNLADQIAWYPAFMKARYKDWVEHLSWDWCISRQRFFGIPFPAWHCKDCGAILLADVNQLPIDPLQTPYTGVCVSCSGSNIVPDTDVMDTWNTSSLSPYIVYAHAYPSAPSPFLSDSAERFLPMSMRPQAHDIIRTWAFDTIVKVWMHHDRVPWESIVISGHVLSDGGGKLSKSKDGGKLTPEGLLAQYPADAIRFWTASGSLGYDSAFSDNQLKIGQRLITKLWNACRFAQPHIEGIDLSVQPADLGAVNEWILHATAVVFNEYVQYLERYEFGLALQPLEGLFWRDVCDNYLELIKHQLFNPAEYAPATVAATRWTLATVILRIVQLYAPYVPHLTETIYQSLYASRVGVQSIHQTTFAALQKPFEYAASAQAMAAVLAITTHVRRLKSEHQLSLKTPLALLEIYEPDAARMAMIKDQEALIKGVAQALEVQYQMHSLDAPILEARDENWIAKVVAN